MSPLVRILWTQNGAPITIEVLIIGSSEACEDVRRDKGFAW